MLGDKTALAVEQAELAPPRSLRTIAQAACVM
jgi:hypothetical protein